MFGAANRVGLVVLIDRPFGTVRAFLGAHELLALANVVLLDDAGRDSLARFATGSVTVVGLPLCPAVTGSRADHASREQNSC